ncbi:CDP-glycerol glycerophosphotransferase (TagB/SpsB family) [Alkalibacillus filiformis]|uniref:CDP-glycerol glycerophosphotransferase (TagB/SpsB family) n=1 Tax=Alkalibacillus filiformis TaxID=200990 RepID=A0ABU0DW41_9BACI|nr:CDP-glycerol glycerophosphotransferase (TagB/SpsB family) [Alkalibacillus filiformis]
MWEKVLEQTNHETVILKTPGTKGEFNQSERTELISFDLKNNYFGFIKGIYHLATCRVVFVDNYYGVLAGTKFNSNVHCVQLWHANGAIKQFGMRDPSITFRSEKAFRRFKAVYNRFTHITVGSDEMAQIFKAAFYLGEDVMLKTGLPRTDLFFDEHLQQSIVNDLERLYPQIKQKKTILYAPTYREQQLKEHSIKLSLQKLYEELSGDYILLLRLHPAIIKKYRNNYPDFVTDVSDYHDLNHLLLVTDYLITDYSSIPFEYSLLNKPMIFYPYDIDEYRKERGFWDDYEDLVPGPIALDTNDIIHLIKQDDFNLNTVLEFSNVWNKYNDGKATINLIETIYGERTSNVIEKQTDAKSMNREV